MKITTYLNVATKVVQFDVFLRVFTVEDVLPVGRSTPDQVSNIY
jgi:hypothetical protein